MTTPRSRPWLLFAMLTVFCWGIWGALIEIPEKAGFPETLGYCVWASTMIVPGVIVLTRSGRLDTSVTTATLGLIIGLLGAGGQLILFTALKTGPAYMVFPIISLSPLLTILLSWALLRERTTRRAWTGIALAIIAMPLLSYQTPHDDGRGGLWVILSFIVFACWGVQAYVMKLATRRADTPSIFVYMVISAILLTPVAIAMTDFDQPINWGVTGPVAAFGIQLLNSVGALLILYAFQHGKAIIVSPLTNAGAPIVTVALSLALYHTVPDGPLIGGIVLALLAVFLMSEE
ncbi:MAG TPA: DMT family transporter [Cyclobacteriaceae bacterium]|jgi:drug/metabolite transporter (DMT)-like permease|nr:MAG: EamA family transporter [Bacteroidota bacterium]